MACKLKNSIEKFRGIFTDKRFSEILIGSTWAFSAQLVSALIGLIASVFIARIYGADVLGVVALIQAFFMLTTIFTVMGTNTSILRLIPEHIVKYSFTSALKVYRKTHFLVILSSLILSALCFVCSDQIASQVFSKPHFTFYFSVASVFVVFRSLMELNTQAVRSLRLIKHFALMHILPQGFNILLLISMYFVFSSKNIPVYALLCSYAITGLVGWGIVEYAFRQKIKSYDKVHDISIRNIIFISLPMLMSATMTFIIGQTGVIILGMFRSDVEVGYYSIAVKIATLASFILKSVNSIVAPKFSHLFHSKNIDELFFVAKKSAKLIFWTSVPILVFFVIAGKPILQIIFGANYSAAYPALVLLAIGQFVNSVSGSTGLFMNMTGNQNAFRNIVFLAAAANIFMNFLFTPEYGIYGAALAAMVSIIGWNLCTLIYIKLKFGKTTGYIPMLM